MTVVVADNTSNATGKRNLTFQQRIDIQTGRLNPASLPGSVEEYNTASQTHINNYQPQYAPGGRFERKPAAAAKSSPPPPQPPAPSPKPAGPAVPQGGPTGTAAASTAQTKLDASRKPTPKPLVTEPVVTPTEKKESPQNKYLALVDKIEANGGYAGLPLADVQEAIRLNLPGASEFYAAAGGDGSGARGKIAPDGGIFEPPPGYGADPDLDRERSDIGEDYAPISIDEGRALQEASQTSAIMNSWDLLSPGAKKGQVDQWIRLAGKTHNNVTPADFERVFGISIGPENDWTWDPDTGLDFRRADESVTHAIGTQKLEGLFGISSDELQQSWDNWDLGSREHLVNQWLQGLKEDHPNVTPFDFERVFEVELSKDEGGYSHTWSHGEEGFQYSGDPFQISSEDAENALRNRLQREPTKEEIVRERRNPGSVHDSSSSGLARIEMRETLYNRLGRDPTDEEITQEIANPGSVVAPFTPSRTDEEVFAGVDAEQDRLRQEAIDKFRGYHGRDPSESELARAIEGKFQADPIPNRADVSDLAENTNDEIFALTDRLSGDDANLADANRLHELLTAQGAEIPQQLTDFIAQQTAAPPEGLSYTQDEYFALADAFSSGKMDQRQATRLMAIMQETGQNLPDGLQLIAEGMSPSEAKKEVKNQELEKDFQRIFGEEIFGMSMSQREALFNNFKAGGESAARQLLDDGVIGSMMLGTEAGAGEPPPVEDPPPGGGPPSERSIEEVRNQFAATAQTPVSEMTLAEAQHALRLAEWLKLNGAPGYDQYISSYQARINTLNADAITGAGGETADDTTGAGDWPAPGSEEDPAGGEPPPGEPPPVDETTGAARFMDRFGREPTGPEELARFMDNEADFTPDILDTPPPVDETEDPAETADEVVDENGDLTKDNFSVDEFYAIVDKIGRGESITPDELLKLPIDMQNNYLESLANGLAPTEDPPTQDDLFAIVDRISAGEEIGWAELGMLPVEMRMEYLNQRYGDPEEGMVATIEKRLQEIIDEMGFDLEAETKLQLDQIDQNTQEARMRLGRQFGIDPGGPKTGRASRAFEALESDANALKASTQLQLRQQARDYTAQSTALLTEAMTGIGSLYESTRQFDATLGLSKEQFDETIRQFNENLEIALQKLGLDKQTTAAAIKQINADIRNSTLATSATIATEWADVLGQVGVEDTEMNVALLGLPEGSSAEDIRDGFFAIMGRAPTEQETMALQQGGTISVKSVPTLRARELGLKVLLQNQERVAKYAQLADELELDRDKFGQAVEESDRQWAVTIGNVAEQFGLSDETFTMAKFILDHRVDKIFFSEGLSPDEKQAAVNVAIQEVGSDFFPTEQAKWLQANRVFDETHGNSNRTIARSFGMEAERFVDGNRRANLEEKRMTDVWAGIMESEAVNVRDLYPYEGEYDSEGRAIDSRLNTNSGVGQTAWREVTKFLWNLPEELHDRFQGDVDAQMATLRVLKEDGSIDPVVYRDFKEAMEESLLEGQGFFTDAQFDVALRAFIAGGMSDSGNVILESDEGVDAFTYTPHNWFGELGEEKRKTLIAVLTGSGLSGSSNDGSFLTDITQLIGTAASAYTTYKVATK